MNRNRISVNRNMVSVDKNRINVDRNRKRFGLAYQKGKFGAGRFLLFISVYIFMVCSSEKAKCNAAEILIDMESLEKGSGESDEKVQETENNRPDKKNSAAGEWKSRNQKYFYYVNQKKVKGLQKIGKKYYYFDSKGIQRTGWQKYKGNYYFFKIANADKGFMVKSVNVNGITLTKSGMAKVESENKAKLDLLVMANQIIEKATQPAMKKSEKLKACFQYLLNHYQYRGSPAFQQTKHWEQDYALAMFKEKHGSCYAYGAAFAFLANAVGYKNCYAVSSGGHGWAEVGGKVYDPSWCLVDRNHSYYGVSFSLSGVGGRPNYKRARRFIVKI